MNIALLKKFGFSDKEIKVYLTLLEYGAISVRSLAELADVNRGSAYDILKKLQEKGLVSYYQKDSKQKFVAEDPEKLRHLVQQEKEALDDVEDKLHDLIPELRSLQDTEGNTPSTKLYEGKSGIRLILEDLLETMADLPDDKKEYYIYSATNASDDINSAYPDFTKKRIDSGVSVKCVSLAQGGKLNGLDERKWLATDEKSATFILIYHNKCAFISRDAKEMPVGVIIENKKIYETQRIIFNELWKCLQ
jgi:HTH-type transcriptional regulator, sugar sensing transcriptional regulator